MDANQKIEEMKKEAEAYDAQTPMDESVTDVEQAQNPEIEEPTIDIEIMERVVNYAKQESTFTAFHLGESGDTRASWLIPAQEMVVHLLTHELELLKARKEHGEDDPEISVNALRCVGPMMQNFLVRHPNSALYGDDAEWEPLPEELAKRIVGKVYRFADLKDVPEASIKIESVQRNIRAHSVLRFNNDNRYAQRIDGATYIDNDTGRVLMPDDGISNILWIEFPYLVHEPVVKYFDMERYVVVRTENDNGPELDGYPLPKCAIKAIAEYQKAHPDLFPDDEEYDDDDDDNEDETVLPSSLQPFETSFLSLKKAEIAQVLEYLVKKYPSADDGSESEADDEDEDDDDVLDDGRNISEEVLEHFAKELAEELDAESKD